jgi:hypothetical protein
MKKFPNGVYLNLNQFKNQTPQYDVDLKIIERSSGDKAMMGGNDYKIESSNDSITKKFIKTVVYAYVKNDSIFLNCYHHKIQIWYALSLTSGNFLAFHSCMSNGDASTVGILGGAIGAAVSSGTKHLNVLSLRTGNVKPLTKEYILQRLKEQPDLQTQFNNEAKQESEDTLIKYINLLNLVTSPESKND